MTISNKTSQGGAKSFLQESKTAENTIWQISSIITSKYVKTNGPIILAWLYHNTNLAEKNLEFILPIFSAGKSEIRLAFINNLVFLFISSYIHMSQINYTGLLFGILVFYWYSITRPFQILDEKYRRKTIMLIKGVELWQVRELRGKLGIFFPSCGFYSNAWIFL